MTRFRKRPPEVDAVQITRAMELGYEPLPYGVTRRDLEMGIADGDWCPCPVGTWIVYHPDGTVQRMKPELFQKAYEPTGG